MSDNNNDNDKEKNNKDDDFELPSSFDIQSSGRNLSDFLKEEVFGQSKHLKGKKEKTAAAAEEDETKKTDNDDDDDDDDSSEGEGEAVNRITHTKEPTLSEQNKSGIYKLIHSFQGAFNFSDNNGKDADNNDTDDDIENKSEGGIPDATTATSVLEIAKNFNDNISNALKESDSNKDVELFWALIQECKGQWETVAEDSKMKEVSPLAFFYFLGFEESRKTPSYRRREHRFYPSLEVETLHDLHDALYLATISYMPKVDLISDGLKDIKGSPWALVYSDIASKPRQPGHYICLKKEQDKIEDSNGGFRFPWQAEKVLDVLMVVRGTKEVSDILSDALIEATPYEDGYAHGGIQESGSYLVKKHTDFLQKLLKESGRDKVRLSIIGHSLGAGAGAIAAMEFNKEDWMDAKAIGFGCPPCLSEDLSKSTKDFITTIVCDSDVVPRMSGATISNVVNDVMSRSYKDRAMMDVNQILDVIDRNSPIKPSEEQKKAIVQHIEEALDSEYERYQVDFDPVDVVLYPPGKCIHLYDDGTGYSGSYVPCTFFNEIDVNRTMISDHMTAGGYSKVFHAVMRAHLEDYRFNFHHNVEAATKLT